MTTPVNTSETERPTDTTGFQATLQAQRWRGEVPIYVICAGLLLAASALLAAKGVFPSASAILNNARLFALSIIAILALDATWQLMRHRPASPAGHLKARYTSRTARSIVVAGLPLLAISIVLMPFFSQMKAAIPLFGDYVWDDAFIRWERAIFFGHDAWQVLQPIFGYPAVTAALATLYQLWLLLLYPGCLFFIFARIDADTRRAFYLSYVLSWAIAGTAMAIWLASVGPCFLEPLLGDTRFGAQMDYLYAANEQVPVMTLHVQELLVEWHQSRHGGIGAGISAMPSMHVAIAFLFWVAMRRVSRLAGRLFLAFFVVIWIGSVHLAYHYALDGLVSVIVVAAIWWASQRLFAWWDAWLAARAQPVLRTNTVPAE